MSDLNHTRVTTPQFYLEVFLALKILLAGCFALYKGYYVGWALVAVGLVGSIGSIIADQISD